MSQNWLLLANTHGRYIFIPKVLYGKKSWITWKSKVLLEILYIETLVWMTLRNVTGPNMLVN